MQFTDSASSPGLRQVATTVAILLGIAISGGPAAAQITFMPTLRLPCNSLPTHATLGDVDGDGKDDIVATLPNEYALAFWLTTNRSLEALGPSTLSTGFQPGALLVCDMNNDGHSDLVVSGSASGLAVFDGNGDGQFAPPRFADTGQGASQLVALDINADGNMDIAAIRSDSLVLLEGDGASGLGVTHRSATGGAALGLASADLDGDGVPDLAYTCTGGVAVCFGRVDGTISPPTTYSMPGLPWGVAVGDLNGDGRPDMAATDEQGGSVSIWVNDGFGAFGTRSARATGSLPFAVQLKDMNDDGRCDLVIGTIIQGIQVFIGTGAMALLPPLTFGNDGSYVGYSSTLAVGDINGDGRADLVVGSDYRANVSVFLQVAKPVIVDVRDVPNDQGGRVFLTWYCSSDLPPFRFITSYRIWRRVPPSPGSAVWADTAVRDGRLLDVLARARPPLGSRVATGEGFWEFIKELPAAQREGYGYTAATTQDSMPSGNPLTTFIVEGVGSNQLGIDSMPDSGYSVDNLAPPAPAPFVASYSAGATTLHWLASRVPDLQEFRLYRGVAPNFTPSGDNLLVATRDTTFRDPTELGFTYKLVAVDVHGNVSRVLTATPERPVATLASLASADAFPDHVSLVWYAADGAALVATVYRRIQDGEWQATAQISPDGEGFLRYKDTEVQPGLRYGYRLGVYDAGVEVFVGEAWVTTVSPVFSLEGVSPNPALVGRFAISFTLPGDEPARLDVLDITGRRVLSRELNGIGAGRHVADLSGQVGLRPGVYLVRLSYGGDSRSQRVVLLM